MVCLDLFWFCLLGGRDQYTNLDLSPTVHLILLCVKGCVQFKLVVNILECLAIERQGQNRHVFFPCTDIQDAFIEVRAVG